MDDTSSIVATFLISFGGAYLVSKLIIELKNVNKNAVRQRKEIEEWYTKRRDALEKEKIARKEIIDYLKKKINDRESPTS
ncbi:hypothetical protein [Aquimarina sp. RZ0]|uniref:hypothetical protein n=1 Tax=Aquimarina sp. RZ0 TaxID=2607730 RepID=UPI0011F1FF28|nr:hypothetical protein [Aquimarina sp. RZ0]KAA1242664.1 hypothetical protein F0000_24605 [Aquimarina sp. RZ0]